MVPSAVADRTRGFRVAVSRLSVPLDGPAAAQQPPVQQQPLGSEPLANRPPVVRSLRASPGGVVFPGTAIAFTTSGAVDPDGDRLTYRWTTPDGSGPVSAAPAMTHTFNQPGRYTVIVTATDPFGASGSASTGVTVGTLDGVWDITCEGPPSHLPYFPRKFVVMIRQEGLRVSGVIEAQGRSQTFPAPSELTNEIRLPRSVSFGVESGYNIWAPWTATSISPSI